MLTDGPDSGSLGKSGGDGSEVLPSPSPTPSSLTELIEEEPYAGDLASPPAANESRDGLVDAFPSHVLLVPDGAQVRSSSVTADGAVVQATLDAAAPGTCTEALISYRGWFSRGGFAETSTSESADRAQLSFTRGSEAVSLSTVTGVDACDITIVAVLEVTS
ncbi:hypothetical protein [Salana multivorans]